MHHPLAQCLGLEDKNSREHLEDFEDLIKNECFCMKACQAWVGTLAMCCLLKCSLLMLSDKYLCALVRITKVIG